MQHETVSTPPSQGGVFCSPPLARAHVDCRNYRRQTGYKYISCSQTTGAGAHAREAIADRAAYFKAWRTANRTPAASPWQSGQRRDWSREIHDVVETVRYHLGNACARVAYAHLHSRNWRKTGLKKPTFYKKLKKVKILLSTVNIGRKRHCAGGAARKA